MKRVVTLLAGVLCVAACADQGGGPPHPVDRLDFPVAVTADPRGDVVWVTSGNFDLAFGGAAVLAIDVRTNEFIPEAAFQIGGFPGPLHLLERDGEVVAGYILSRDEDRLYHVSIGGSARQPVVTCDGGDRVTNGILKCPRSRAIDTASVENSDGDKTELSLGEEPFGAVVRKSRAANEPDLLLTGGMRDGNLATFTLDETDGTPTLVGNLDLLNGVFAMTENPSTGRVYTASKLTNVFQVLEIDGTPADPDDITVENPFVTTVANIVIPEGLAVDRARGLAVSVDGTRLYASYRAPDSVVVIDIGQDVSGSAADRVIAKIPVSNNPGDIVVVAGATLADERVYVACYSENLIEVIDPNLGVVVDSIRTGRGPFGLAHIENTAAGINRLYVTNFLDESVGVIELDPTSPYYLTQVAEIR
ncbi:MAG: hypothetical protein ACI9MR_002852 [Myxococcota bacterium]